MRLVYFHRIPEYDLFEMLKPVHLEEYLNINNLNFRPLLFQLSNFVIRLIRSCYVPF